MNSIKLIGAYSAMLEAIATAASGTPHGLTDEQKTENKSHKESVAGSIRAFAKATAADGVEVEAANEALRIVLTAKECKAGTIKGYGASFRGFRKMIDDEAVGPEGKPLVETANTAVAQQYVASPEVKEAKELRDRLKAGIKDWTLLQLASLVEYVESENEAAKTDKTESIAPESTESREARRAA